MLKEDDDKSVSLLGQQTVRGHSQLQSTPVATQITPTEHAHCPTAAVDALSNVVHNSFTHLVHKCIKTRGVKISN